MGKIHATVILAAALALPGCAITEAQEALNRISIQLAETQQALQASEGDPRSEAIVTGLAEVTVGIGEIADEFSAKLAMAEGTQDKIGTGLRVAGGGLGGPLGEVAGLIGALLVGGGGAGAVARSARKSKEASFNHALREGIAMGERLAKSPGESA